MLGWRVTSSTKQACAIVLRSVGTLRAIECRERSEFVSTAIVSKIDGRRNIRSHARHQRVRAGVSGRWTWATTGRWSGGDGDPNLGKSFCCLFVRWPFPDVWRGNMHSR